VARQNSTQARQVCTKRHQCQGHPARGGRGQFVQLPRRGSTVLSIGYLIRSHTLAPWTCRTCMACSAPRYERKVPHVAAALAAEICLASPSSNVQTRSAYIVSATIPTHSRDPIVSGNIPTHSRDSIVTAADRSLHSEHHTHTGSSSRYPPDSAAESCPWQTSLAAGAFHLAIGRTPGAPGTKVLALRRHQTGQYNLLHATMHLASHAHSVITSHPHLQTRHIQIKGTAWISFKLSSGCLAFSRGSII
jgi:hypothetical protein